MSDFYEKQYGVLMSEWTFTQDSIRGHDDIIFKIRGWAITLSSAALGYAYAEGDADLCLYIMLPTGLIWLIDGMFKSFQRSFIARDREIRTYLKSDDFKKDFDERSIQGIDLSRPYPTRTGELGWKWGGIKGQFTTMFLRNVVLSYLPILALQLGTYFLLR